MMYYSSMTELEGASLRQEGRAARPPPTRAGPSAMAPPARAGPPGALVTIHSV